MFGNGSQSVKELGGVLPFEQARASGVHWKMWLKAWVAELAFGVLLILGLVRVFYFSRVSEAQLISVIPDDAFYYIKIAQNRSHLGIWSFDGVSSTTGFHYLHAAFLALVYRLFPDIGWRALFFGTSAFAMVIYVAAAFLTIKVAIRWWGHSTGFWASLPFFARVTLAQITGMMESCLVLFFAAATLYGVSRERRTSLWQWVGLFLIGFLGSLSRSDYGLFPGMLFLVLSLIALRVPGQSRYWLRGALIFSGAVAGVVAVLFHNYLISGHLFQSSAQVKLYWSSLTGHDSWVPFRLIGTAGLPGFSLFGKWAGCWFLGLFLLGGLACGRQGRFLQRRPQATGLFLASMLTLGGYVIFYRYNSQALQYWYASNLVVPFSFVLASWGAFLPLSVSKRYWGGLLLFVVTAGSGSGAVLNCEWRHQEGLMQAGRYLRTLSPQVTYGAWNAGIIGYFSEARIYNLDGLTNDEVLPYVKSNTLLDYIKQRHVDFVVDYSVMLEQSRYRRRGGYEDPRVERCLSPVRTIDEGAPSFEDSHVTLYRVKPDCL